MKKILIGIPCAKYVELECFRSIYDLIVPKGYKTELFTPQNYSIDVSRNRIADAWRQEKADYILWVDSDIVLPKDALKNMLEHDKYIVSGVYAYKLLQNKNAVVKRFKKDEVDKYEDIPIEEITSCEEKLIKVDAFGFGCVLTKTSVFDTIKYPQFIYTADMGEDIYFCRKAQNAGYDLFIDNRVLCGHKGEVNYNIRSG